MEVIEKLRGLYKKKVIVPAFFLFIFIFAILGLFGKLPIGAIYGKKKLMVRKGEMVAPGKAPLLMVATGSSCSTDADCDNYFCSGNDYYIDTDGDRKCEDYDNDGDTECTGYEMSYGLACYCGGRYDYNCSSSGCTGYIDDDCTDVDTGGECSDVCDGGEERCYADTVEECQDWDDDDCTDGWKEIESCGVNEVCKNAECVKKEKEEAQFAVTSISAPSSTTPGSKVRVEAKVKNTGDEEGEIRVTCGIYADKWKGKVFGLLPTVSISPDVVGSSQCCKEDKFSAETDSFTIGAGESKVAGFDLIAPAKESVFHCGRYEGKSNWGDSFTIACGPFKECFQGYAGEKKEKNMEISKGCHTECPSVYNRKGATWCGRPVLRGEDPKAVYKCGNFDEDKCLDKKKVEVCTKDCKNGGCIVGPTSWSTKVGTVWYKIIKTFGG